jgi:hypothetical protein
MSGDINVQTFSGKVNITSNLLVGSSHLFVDTTNNRVGITTANPDAGLHVNSNAYVDTNFRVGSDIAMNVTSGRITAGSFEGDGSLLENVPGDSGSWVKGSSSNVHLAVSTDNVGIGVLDSIHKLDVDGDINISTGSTLRVGGTPAVFSNWTVHTNASDIYRSSGNVGIGTTSPNNSLHIYKAAAEGTSGLFIEKASGGAGTTAALFFGVNAPGENPGVAKAAIFYERNLVNGRGDIKFCNDEVNDANAVTTETVDTRMIIKNNGNVGIGTVDPGKKLHVYGSIQCHNTGTTGDENGLFLQSVGDWYNLSPGNDGYLHLLGGASGQGNMSGNFSSMKLAKLITYSDLDVNGNINISSGNKVRIDGDDAVFPRRTLVNGTSYSLTSGSWTKLCDFGHNYLDGAYAIKIEWNYGGTGHYWAGMATGMVPAKSYTHVQYNHAPDEPLSLNHFYHHRTVGRFEFTLDSDNYWGASYGRIALWVKGGSTATHQFYVDVRKIL